MQAAALPSAAAIHVGETVLNRATKNRASQQVAPARALGPVLPWFAERRR